MLGLSVVYPRLSSKAKSCIRFPALFPNELTFACSSVYCSRLQEGWWGGSIMAVWLTLAAAQSVGTCLGVGIIGSACYWVSSLSLRLNSFFLPIRGGISPHAAWIWKRGDTGNSFVPTFFDRSFVIIILTMVSHVASLALVKVDWHINSWKLMCLWGQHHWRILHGALSCFIYNTLISCRYLSSVMKYNWNSQTP